MGFPVLPNDHSVTIRRAIRSTPPDGTVTVRVVIGHAWPDEIDPPIVLGAPRRLFGALDRPTGVVSLRFDPDGGELRGVICACGNLPESVGFYRSDAAGVELPMDSQDWEGHYTCPECDLIIDTVARTAAYCAELPRPEGRRLSLGNLTLRAAALIMLLTWDYVLAHAYGSCR